jgi:hypothetical protein
MLLCLKLGHKIGIYRVLLLRRLKMISTPTKPGFRILLAGGCREARTHRIASSKGRNFILDLICVFCIHSRFYDFILASYKIVCFDFI